MSHKLKKYIWFQVEERDKNYVDQLSAGELIQLCREIKTKENIQVAASSLILRAKKANEQEYTLDTDFFNNVCGNDFNRLINRFNIARNNPIKVTLPDNNRIKELEAQIAALQLAQVQSLNEIHVRYNNQAFSFNQSTLEGYGVSNVEDLIEVLKPRLRKLIEKVSDKDIILRRGEEVLNSETPITGLYNTANNALRVIIVDTPLINLIVKAPGERHHFCNQRIGSLGDVIEFIKNEGSLAQLITDDTILLGDDNQVLTLQHLATARDSGTLNITLSLYYETKPSWCSICIPVKLTTGEYNSNQKY